MRARTTHRREKKGHVFDARFDAAVLDTDAHLFEVLRFGDVLTVPGIES